MAADTVHENQRSVERDVTDEIGRRTFCLEERDNCKVCITFLEGKYSTAAPNICFSQKRGRHQ